MRKNRNRIGIILLALILLLAIPSVHADGSDNNSDTTVTVVVISDGNVTGYINGTSVNGSVSYYIDGIEVSNEFSHVWNAIRSVKSSANYAYWIADSAMFMARNNNNSITLIKTDIKNNTAKVYLLRDELVAFEGDYVMFKNDTVLNFSKASIRMDNADVSINDMHSQIEDKEGKLYAYGDVQTVAIAGLTVILVYLAWQIDRQKKKEKVTESKEQDIKVEASLHKDTKLPTLSEQKSG